MKRKPYLTTGALFMGLIVILGAIGIVNGLWSKTLRVDGTVTTGDLNTDWDCAWTNDDALTGASGTDGPGCVDGTTAVVEPAGDDGADPNNNDWPGFTDFTPFVEKDVGECTVTVGDSTFGDQIATVTIVNAYPSYECTITLGISNTGSIPFNFIGATIDLVSPLELLDDTCQGLGDVDQIDPGEDELITCTVHVMQSAEQNTCTGTTTTPDTFPVVDHTCTETPNVYEFEILACVAQWNEAATQEQCVAANEEGPETVPEE